MGSAKREGVKNVGDAGDDGEEGKGKEMEEKGWDDEPCAQVLIRPDACSLSCLEAEVIISWEACSPNLLRK